MVTDTRICAFNPIIGRELESNYAPLPTKAKKVLVVGGGPGGIETAVTAANRGHSVILCEKSGELGGALRCERCIPFKSDLYGFIATKAIELKNAGVDVRLNTEVTPEYVEKEQPDVLVIAVGAEPIIPPIPGMDGDNVVIANDLSDETERIGQKVVILGGGLVGCEAAVHLAQEGKDVTVVEMLPDVAIDANGRHRPILMQMLEPVTKLTNMRGVRVTDEGLVCAGTDGVETLIPADTVICAVGQRPLRRVVDLFLDSAPEVIQVGDCVQPRRVTDAVSAAITQGFTCRAKKRSGNHNVFKRTVILCARDA
jgi:NADPH-dependent 2,4-dienoyl-CoA reductase/sulfur reductase-like enzyme